MCITPHRHQFFSLYIFLASNLRFYLNSTLVLKLKDLSLELSNLKLLVTAGLESSQVLKIHCNDTVLYLHRRAPQNAVGNGGPLDDELVVRGGDEAGFSRHGCYSPDLPTVALYTQIFTTLTIHINNSQHCQQ